MHRLVGIGHNENCCPREHYTGARWAIAYYAAGFADIGAATVHRRCRSCILGHERDGINLPKLDGQVNSHVIRTDEELNALAIEYRESHDPERRNEIRLIFWAMEQEFAYTMLLRRMRRAGVPESEYAKDQELLDRRVFYEDAFNKIAAGWDPNGGRTFRNYLKWAITKRSGDVVRELKVSQKETTNGPGPGHGEEGAEEPSRRRASKLLDALNSLDVLLKREHGVWEETGDEEDVGGNASYSAPDPEDGRDARNLASVLANALAALEQQKGPRNPDLGRQARAVFELIHKAYIQPDDMGKHTLRMAETNGGCSFDRLKQAHFDDQRLLTRLDGAMTAASRAIERAESRQSSQSDELSRTGYTASQLAALESEGRKRSVHKGHSARKKALRWPQKEESYIKLCARLIRLKRHRQILLEENMKYKHAVKNSTWTRSEPEVARMLKMSQPTVHRLLEFATDGLR